MHHHFSRGRHGDRERDDHHASWQHALWHAIGRHHHGRHRDHGSRGSAGPGGFDGEGVPRARKFSSTDLQLLLLALLADQTSHGYELIKALESRSNGFYSPSPGMVYPALTFLEDLGFVTVELEGNRKRYALADAGRAYLEDNRGRVDQMLQRLAQIASRMDSVRRAFSEGDPADAASSSSSLELSSARMSLRAALKEALEVPGGAKLDEQKRIAEILTTAAQSILKRAE
jgi:DNA-binding PadR family transcriptional regulator